jgi:hypothetical protein
MPNNQIGKAASLMGRRSYRVRLDRFGIERIRAIARENGKKSKGRPPKKGKRDGN